MYQFYILSTLFIVSCKINLVISVRVPIFIMKQNQPYFHKNSKHL